MPVPLVVVELPAADVNTPQTVAMLEACSTALGSGKCVSAESADDEASALAVVSWGGSERLRARVEVGRRRDAREAFRSREIVFQTNDEPNERFRTVGFTIASLASEIDQGAEPASATATELAPRAPPEVHTQSWRPLTFSAGVLTGPGLDTGLHRLGISGRAGYFPQRLPLFATISVSYAVRSRDERGVAVSWLTPALGAGAVATLPLDFAVRARVEGLYERVVADAEDSALGLTEQASRWVFGGRAGLDLVWPQRGAVGALLVFDLEKLAGTTTVNAFGTRVGSADPIHYDFGVALELRADP